MVPTPHGKSQSTPEQVPVYGAFPQRSAPFTDGAGSKILSLPGGDEPPRLRPSLRAGGDGSCIDLSPGSSQQTPPRGTSRCDSQGASISVSPIVSALGSVSTGAAPGVSTAACLAGAPRRRLSSRRSPVAGRPVPSVSFRAVRMVTDTEPWPSRPGCDRQSALMARLFGR